jgi:hypothetical protein
MRMLNVWADRADQNCFELGRYESEKQHGKSKISVKLRRGVASRQPRMETFEETW